jgi:predicted nucleic acid-binding protein
VILVDTSAWIEFDRASGSRIDRQLTRLIGSGGADVAVTEPILMEVLAGARDNSRHHDLRRLLTSFNWLPTDPVADFEGAAHVYRSCRAAGITPRGLLDCMIVSIALRTRSSLLCLDRDFEQIATVLPLTLAPT